METTKVDDLIPKEATAGLYVDEVTEYPACMLRAHIRRVSTRWSHLWCDAGREEALHALAARIGMKRQWFQDRDGFPHYDLVPRRREMAVKLGVLEMSLRAWIKKRRAARDGSELHAAKLYIEHFEHLTNRDQLDAEDGLRCAVGMKPVTEIDV